MSYVPVIPSNGLAGWRFLQRTYDQQFETHTASARIQRDGAYFAENIGNVTSAQELVEDRRLLTVALSAFGLEADLNNRYFVQKILEDGSRNDDALANKLTDDRYRQFSAAFGFGPGEFSKTNSTDDMLEIVASYNVRTFEVSVGQQDSAMRVALYANRELAELASTDISDDTKWFKILGQPPLRELFETAFGLPSGFGRLDIDRQADVLKTRTQGVTGDSRVTQFSDPDNLSKLVDLFQARSQIKAFSSTTSSAAAALTLLRS